MLDRGVRDGVVPGGVLVVGDGGRVVERAAFGRTYIAPLDAGGPVAADTVYDLASVSKPLATVAVMMRLVADGALAPDDAVARWVPELVSPGAGAMRLLHLASHRSGLPAHVKFYERVLAGERLGAPSAREAILRMTGSTPLHAAPGERALYSDLGFILLGFAIERAGGARLDELARRLVFEPLAMSSARYVDLEAGERLPHAAPTERGPYRGLVVGEVHDQNTHAAGGILGQAGVFATADDVSRFAAAIVAAARGEPGVFDPDTVRRFLAPIPGTSWRLGWDTPDRRRGVSHAGDRWPRDGVGHLGFIGTSLWLDPPRARWVVLLTNRIHPVVRDKSELRAFRAAVMDTVVDLLERA